MPAPLTPLGTLNRLRASVIWSSFQSLNVSASFLGKEGINFTPEGDGTAMIGAMAGAVPSPEPYQMVSFRIALIKSQQLADFYKQQYETNVLIGNCTIRPDAYTLSPFQLFNCAIVNVESMRFNGDEAVFPIVCRGTYYINSALWDSI